MIRLERLEYHVREELNKTASRAMVVLHPLKVVIINLEPSSIIDDAKKWSDAPVDDASFILQARSVGNNVFTTMLHAL
ncbi:putative glutamine--tRNA ligase [Helianthus debilis subsp. tardiflorus]